MTQKKIFSLLLAVLMLLTTILTGCAKDGQETSPATTIAPGVIQNSSRGELAQTFAVAVLEGDWETVDRCLHPAMAGAYSNMDFVFTGCTATIAGESALMIDGLERHMTALNTGYGLQVMIDAASQYILDITASYNGREYTATMRVTVAQIEDINHVIEAGITMSDNFYEDNFPAGDYYYDMHGEE